MSRSLSVYAAGCMLALGTAGCGAPSVFSDQPNPAMALDGEPLVSCGGIGFNPAAMTDGVEGLADREEVGEALSRLVEEAGIDAPLALQGVAIADADWFVLGGNDQSILVATGPWNADGPGQGAQSVELQQTANGWRADRWGDCNLSLVEPAGLMWARMRAEKGALSPNATKLSVFVSEIECTSARDPDQYLKEPIVVESTEAVTVYWTSTPPVGGQECPGNPEVRRVIELDAPLGQRTLLDGSTWPPTPATHR